MKNKGGKLLNPVVSSIFLAIFLLLSFNHGHAEEGAVVTVSSNNISAAASVSDATSIEIRVAGPHGFYNSRKSSNGAVDWYPNILLEDGEYRFEVFVTVGTDANDEPIGNSSSTQLFHNIGRFNVINGIFNLIEDNPPPLPPNDQSSLSTEFSLGNIVGLILDFFVPPSEAADLTASSTFPRVYFEDTSIAGFDWNLVGDDSFWGVWNYDTSSYPLYIYDGAPSGSIIAYDTGNIKIGTTGIYIYATSDDVALANSSVYIDDSLNFVGIGTTAPLTDLHIASVSPKIRFDDVDGQLWDMYGGSNYFYIQDETNSTYPFILEELAPSYSLTVEGTTGDVGLGTLNPSSPLHLLRNNGTAQILVEEASTTTAKRQLYRLRNNGQIRFSLENSDTNNIWDFLTDTNGFNITRVGTGGGEFLVRDDGRVQMGPGATINFDLQTNGNLVIEGVLTENSDVNAKENIRQVSADEMLDKVIKLPINSWNYKDDNSNHRHLGPMAQDFHAMFNLGADERHIASLDLAGVALAAIKAVKSEKDEEIELLKKENELLNARLMTLENFILHGLEVSLR